MESTQLQIDPNDDQPKVGLISMNELMDFLKLTCQVQESITSDNRNVVANKSEIDYNQISKNELVNVILAKEKGINPPKNSQSSDDIKHSPSRTKRTLSTKTSPPRKLKDDNKFNIDPVINEKLDEVINEGILDSVLPFICPSPTPSTNSTQNVKKSAKAQKPTNVKPMVSEKNLEFPSQPKKQESGSEKSTPPTTDRHDGFVSGQPTVRENQPKKKSVQIDSPKTDCEITIHVCDEVKGMSRDFVCPQKLLISKMGYFADVTAGQKLEDMDISVHCDLQIFEWLMKWVRKDKSHETAPHLEANNVVPILVSASFLQMEPLLLDCLSYCHSHLTEVVRSTANLSCLNDSILSRLAAMFTNLELEVVKDKKERVTPRLWTKLIQSLCEPEPQALRGHYASLADLFRCNRCGKYLTQAISNYIHCLPQNMRLNRWGQLVSLHVKDTSWNITNYVATLYKELKSWRKVYWRLWGNCHFLFCSVCNTHFPVYQMNWCLYHPDQPQFLGPISEGKMPGPTGRYPCCGQQAFRYETLPGPSGCQYREHTVLLESDRDKAIINLAQLVSENGALFEPPPPKANNPSNEPWFNGMSLTPHKSRSGLLPNLHMDNDQRRIGKKPVHIAIDSSSDTESSEQNYVAQDAQKFQKQSPRDVSSSSDGCESETEVPKRRNRRIRGGRRKCYRKFKMVEGRYWSDEVSARSNQDIQREYEERAMKQVIAMVGRKSGSDTMIQYQHYHQGGSYVKLEAEWRDAIKHRHNSSTKMRR